MNFGTNEFTLLSDEQTFGSRKIDVIEQLGGKCAISDFAILLGAYVSDDYHVDDDSSLKGRTDWWYLSSSAGDGDVRAVDRDGAREWASACRRSGAVRPALPYSNISDISPNGVRGRSRFLEVEYGEYPQYVVDTSLGRTLDSEFSAGRLRKTGKTYTTDSRRWNAHSEKFNPVEHEEYEYNGKRYVRVKSNDTNENFKLTNGVTTHPGDYFWLEVSPIVWYVDEKSKMLVSKTLLASGIRFCNDAQYRDDFKTTEMYMFLNKYFAKDIGLSIFSKKENLDNEKSNEINDVIDEIKKYLPYYDNGDDIMNNIVKLVSDYNDKIESIKNNKEILTLDRKDPKLLYLELVDNLKEILKKLKGNYEEYKEYFKILDELDACINILKNNDIESENNSELANDILLLKSVILPYLNDENKNKDIMNIFIEEKNRVNTFLRDNKNNLPYKDMSQFEVYLRKKMQPYLINISTDVRNKDIVNEIKEGYLELAKGMYKEIENKHVNFYFNEINEIIAKINHLGNDNDIEVLKTILENKVDLDDNIDDVLKSIYNLYKDLVKLLIDIEDRINNEKEMDSYIVNIKK